MGYMTAKEAVGNGYLTLHCLQVSCINGNREMFNFELSKDA